MCHCCARASIYFLSSSVTLLYNTLQDPSLLTEEDLAAVGVECNDAAELKYIAGALAAAEPQPKTLKDLRAYIAVRLFADRF